MPFLSISLASLWGGDYTKTRIRRKCAQNHRKESDVKKTTRFSDIATQVAASAVEAHRPPLLRLDWSQRSRVTINFGPNPANEGRNALPTGMRGCKLWYALGGISTKDEDWQFLVDDRRSPYVHVVIVDVPVSVAYRAQYFDTQTRTGPSSYSAIAPVTV